MKPNDYIPRIVCAAIRRADGLIVCGPRHFDPTMRALMKAIDGNTHSWHNGEQGFIDAKGKFLTRQGAHKLAIQLGQIKYRCGGDDNKLFSENLY